MVKPEAAFFIVVKLKIRYNNSVHLQKVTHMMSNTRMVEYDKERDKRD